MSASLDALAALEQRNKQIDQQQDAIMREVGAVVQKQEERLAAQPVGVDTVRVSRELRRSAAAVASSAAPPPPTPPPPADLEPLPVGGEFDEEAEALALEAAAAEAEAGLVARAEHVAQAASLPPAGPSVGANRGGGAGSARASALGAPPEEGLGGEAALRHQKARLAVTLEELERLREQLAAKTSAVAAAEASVRELQQKTSLLSKSERSLQTALEKERATNAEGSRRSETLERELAVLRKQGDELSKREKVAGADTRSKDVRLNRALEELDRTRAQLKALREEREGAGHGARLEAQRLAAENTRLRKRQSELILAFKKQAKLIDVLKRQKLHVEAATLLSFTEEEFSKTLELGERQALS